MDNWQRNVRTLLEESKGKTMVRKVDTYEYESLETMIQRGHIDLAEIKAIFTDQTYNKWYEDRNFK